MNINNYFSTTQLKERGWSDSMIRKFMPLPDEFLPNPYYPNSGHMRLYLKTRAGKIEKTEQFMSASLSASKRADMLNMCFEQKKGALSALAHQINIPDFTRDEASIMNSAALEFEMGRENYNHSKDEQTKEIHKIAINMLLEIQGPVIWQLDDFYHHQGVCEARKIVRQRILAKIIRTYPVLKDECLAMAIAEEGNV